MYQAFKRAATPQEKVRYLYALSYVAQPDLARRTLGLYLSAEVKRHAPPWPAGGYGEADTRAPWPGRP